MNIKTEFSIKDLETLSGIKAHTIRIWEKRYGILEPNRSSTNIRSYDIESLQKILNVSLLNTKGHKVSKIAKLDASQLQEKVLSQQEEHDDVTVFLNQFKLAMLTFDNRQFNKTFNDLSSIFSFEDIFIKVFVPFLETIGILWQTKTITPAHERFISNLIKQKVLLKMEQLEVPTCTNETYVLFLPLNESHDLGLLFINYMLLKSGKHTVYLGQSVPTDNLLQVQKVYDNTIFISYLTVQPTIEKYADYIDNLQKVVLSVNGDSLHLTGRMTKMVESNPMDKDLHFYDNLKKLVDNVVSK